MDIGKQLTKLLTTKKLLANEYIGGGGELINLLFNCVNTNYILNPQQLSKLIKQMCEYTNNGPFLGAPQVNYQNIVTHIFTKHKISEKDIIMMSNNYWIIYNNQQHFWLGYMFRIKYDFSVTELGVLTKFVLNDYGDYDTIHNNVIFGLFMGLLYKNKNVVDKYFKIIKNSNEPFNPVHLEIIIKMSEQHTFSDEHSKKILDVLLNKCNDGNKTVFEPLMKSICSGSNRYIFEYIIENFGYTEKFVEFIFEKVIKHYPSLIFNLYDRGYKLTMDNVNCLMNLYMVIGIDNVLKYTCTKNRDKPQQNIYIHELYEMFKLTPTLNELHIACKNSYTESGIYLMDKFNIIPEKETLDICVSSQNYTLIEKVLHYKLTPDEETINKLKGSYYCDTPKIVDLLLAHGLEINSSHLDFLISNKIIVNDLERFGIKYDDKLYFLCYLNDFFPDQYTSKFELDNNLKKLYKVCKTRRLKYDKLKEFLKTSKSKLNRYALEYLIYCNKEVAVLLMDEFNCVPSMITSYKKCDVPYKMLLDIIKENGISEIDMLKSYEINIV
jgi:hypothetical protein